MLTTPLRLSGLLILLSLVLIGLNLRPSMAAIGPMLNSIRSDISLTFTMASLLTMLPVFAMGIAMFFGINLSNRMGEHQLIAYSLVLIAGATLYRYYAQNAENLLATAVVAGLGIALIQATVPKIIKSRFPNSIELYMGVYVTAIMGGAALSASASPFIGEYSSNWRVALSVWGCLAVLALVSWFTVKQYIGSTLRKANRTVPQNPPAFYKSSRAWILGIFFGLGTSAYTCVLAFTTSLLR